MKTIKMGMIANRHDIPEVEDYMFNTDIPDVMAFNDIEFAAITKLNEVFCNEPEYKYETIYGYIPNIVNAYDDIPVYYRGELRLYVTGLTSVAFAISNACYRLGIKLVLMHYNRDTGEYLPQTVCNTTI